MFLPASWVAMKTSSVSTAKWTTQAKAEQLPLYCAAHIAGRRGTWSGRHPGVLEFKGGEGETVDEEHHVDGKRRVGLAVMHLPGDREDVAVKARRDLRVEVVEGQAVQGSVACASSMSRPRLSTLRMPSALDRAVEPFQQQPFPVGTIPELMQLQVGCAFKKSPEFLGR